MSTTAISNQKSPFARGLIAGSSIAIGYLPAALTFGLLARSTGLTFLETMAMSLFVYAGAAQYMALTLIAMGTGAFEIIFTTFIVNIRHLLMSASVRERIEMIIQLLKPFTLLELQMKFLLLRPLKKDKSKRALFLALEHCIHKLGDQFRHWLLCWVYFAFNASTKYGDCVICDVYCPTHAIFKKTSKSRFLSRKCSHFKQPIFTIPT
ncbi:hypothetical protein JCM9140_1224 [Halalkalibacter wakoensis JCM 9140]|uniref:Branched-chain amino acid transporter n=1 Tax=Halalkalibacter wakoensis JCM 9140 TaxID=1236970 RepID=W4PZS3_9BACI|nr:hypothetical protein JCM9140_1224 [Halalkalibacter wakoensis JCM 9140]